MLSWGRPASLPAPRRASASLLRRHVACLTSSLSGCHSRNVLQSHALIFGHLSPARVKQMCVAEGRPTSQLQCRSLLSSCVCVMCLAIWCICKKSVDACLGMQVQHEPTTINHVHVDGRGWAFNLEDEAATRASRGHPSNLMPIVLIRVAFADGDAYTWHKARLLRAGNNITYIYSDCAVVRGIIGHKGGHPSCSCHL